MNRYEELCIRQQKIFNGLPIAYAFTEDQLLDAMKKLGVESHRDLYSGPGGALYRKADSKLIRDTVNRLATEKMDVYPELFRVYMNAKTDYLADCAKEE